MSKVTIFSAFFLLFCSVAAKGSDCHSFLNSFGDSHSFQIKTGEEPADELIFAETAIFRALRPRCDKNDFGFNLSDTENNKCAEIIAGNPMSQVCYLESKNLGYFFVIRDLLDGANIIWNRWD